MYGGKLRNTYLCFKFAIYHYKNCFLIENCVRCVRGWGPAYLTYNLLTRCSGENVNLYHRMMVHDGGMQ